jgi:hypothetical protein
MSGSLVFAEAHSGSWVDEPDWATANVDAALRPRSLYAAMALKCAEISGAAESARIRALNAAGGRVYEGHHPGTQDKPLRIGATGRISCWFFALSARTVPAFNWSDSGFQSVAR